MPLLNYTTSIQTAKTVSEIQEMLARAKARAVLTEYDPEGLVSAISFRMKTQQGDVLSFRLPARIDNVQKVLLRDAKVPRPLKTREQAAKVAWRIVKDWLAAQLAFIESEQADFEQLFLHCVQDQAGRTVYETYQSKKFSQLALTS